MVPIRFLLRPGDVSESARYFIQLGVFLSVQLLLVPLLLRKFWPKAIGVASLTVLLASLVALGLSQAFQKR